MSKRYKIRVRFRKPRKVNQFAYTPGNVEDPEDWKLPQFEVLFNMVDRDMIDFRNRYVERWKNPKERLDKYNDNLYMILVSLAERKDIGKKLEEVVTLFKKFPELQNDDFFLEQKTKFESYKNEIKESERILRELKKSQTELRQKIKFGYITQKRKALDDELSMKIAAENIKIEEQKKLYDEAVFASDTIEKNLNVFHKLLVDIFENLPTASKNKMFRFIKDNLNFLSPLFGQDVGSSYIVRGSTKEQFVSVVEKFIEGDVNRRKFVIKLMTSNPIYFFNSIQNKDVGQKVNEEIFFNDFAPLYEELKRLNYPLSSGALISSGFSLLDVKNELLAKFNLSDKDLGVFPSKYYSEFGLNNSSGKEYELFDKLHDLGLNPIPANIAPIVYFDNENKGLNRGFVIDFILPCQQCICGDDGCNLSNTVKIVGEYFGWYGATYEAKKTIKIGVQKQVSPIISSSFLHFEQSDIKNPCEKLNNANIASSCNGASCEGKFQKSLYVPDSVEKKRNYVILMQHIFLYSYLLNESIQSAPEGQKTVNFLNKEIYENVLKKRKDYIDEFEFLLNLVDHNDKDNKYFIDYCNRILQDYLDERKRETSKRRTKVSNYTLRVKY
jgi:hypothetical protein